MDQGLPEDAVSASFSSPIANGNRQEILMRILIVETPDLRHQAIADLLRARGHECPGILSFPGIGTMRYQ